MYVRTITADVVPGREREAERIFREQVVPVVRMQPGYLGAALYIDHRSHQAQTVSYWRDKESVEATAEGSSYLGQVTGMLRSCLVNRDFEHWEVAYFDFARLDVIHNYDSA